MDISSSVRSPQIIPSVTTSAVEGINTQQQLLERNVEQVSEGQGAEAQNTNSQDKGLVEQQQIVTAAQANARSLEAANERLGTLIDIKTYSIRSKLTEFYFIKRTNQCRNAYIFSLLPFAQHMMASCDNLFILRTNIVHFKP